MTFGFATLVDLLSWATALLLAAKVIATVILLRRDRATWFDTRNGAILWWTTKVTPLLAVPCVIAIALIQRSDGDFWGYSALMVFVVIAVGAKVWSRFFRRRLPA